MASVDEVRVAVVTILLALAHIAAAAAEETVHIEAVAVAAAAQAAGRFPRTRRVAVSYSSRARRHRRWRGPDSPLQHHGNRHPIHRLQEHSYRGYTILEPPFLGDERRDGALGIVLAAGALQPHLVGRTALDLEDGRLAGAHDARALLGGEVPDISRAAAEGGAADDAAPDQRRLDVATPDDETIILVRHGEGAAVAEAPTPRAVADAPAPRSSGW